MKPPSLKLNTTISAATLFTYIYILIYITAIIIIIIYISQY